MKALFFSLLFFSLTGFAQTKKFVAMPPLGSDANSGADSLHPYATLTKARDNVGGVPGDSILVRRGDRFPELVFLANGTKGQIYWGAWGSGRNPVMQGYRDISNLLTPVSGFPGLFSYQSATLPTAVRVLMIDTVLQMKGRWPRTGFRVFEDTLRRTWNNTTNARDTLPYPAWKGVIALVDKELSEEAPADLSGAELVISKMNWALDVQKLVKQQVDTMFTFTANGQSFPSYEPFPGNGYWIQNHWRLCTQWGDWAFDSLQKAVYLYLPNDTPSKYSVWVSDLSRSFNYASTGNTIENWDFIGHNDYNVITGATGISNTFRNCRFIGSGIAGFYTTDNPKWRFRNCEFRQHANQALKMLRSGTPTSPGPGCDSTEVLDCVISDIGTIGGLGQTGSGYMGLQVVGDSVKISRNKIKRIGLHGMFWEGAGCEISNNDIDSVCLTRTDCGGIYSYKGGGNGGAKWLPASGVYSNVMFNTVSNVIGTGTSVLTGGVKIGFDSTNDHGKGMGFYADEKSYNINYYGNTARNVASTGFFFNNPFNIYADSNTVFNAWRGGYLLVYDVTTNGQASNINWTRNRVVLDTISSLNRKPSYGRKKFFELDTDINGGSITAAVGTMDNNIYYTVDTTYQHFWTQNGSSASFIDWTFSGWKTATGKDFNTQVRKYTTRDILINPSATDRTAALNQAWKRLDGSTVSGSIVVPAYGNVLLFDGVASSARKVVIRGAKVPIRAGKARMR